MLTVLRKKCRSRRKGPRIRERGHAGWKSPLIAAGAVTKRLARDLSPHLPKLKKGVKRTERGSKATNKAVQRLTYTLPSSKDKSKEINKASTQTTKDKITQIIAQNQSQKPKILVNR